MKAFIAYLKAQRHYNQRTIKEKIRQVEKIKSLCGTRSLEKIGRSELLKIIAIQKSRYSDQSVNNQLQSLEQYFYFLIETGRREDHPLKGFRIKTRPRPLLRGILTPDKLDSLYRSFPEKGHFGGRFDLYAGRNKVILGLIIYQGLGAGSLEHLVIDDLDLSRSLIRVPSTSSYKLKQRELVLEGVQILALERYIKVVRPKIIRLQGKDGSSDQLFPKSDKTRFSSITGSILRKLKATDQIHSLYQLRASRIAHWLKIYNLREVQYMAGYKSLQSLEPFNTDEIERLKLSVKKYHPLG